MTHGNGSLARYRSFIPVRLALALLAGLLALFPATLVRADLAPGHLDTGFDPGTGANGPVYAVARRHDGKVLTGGSFTQVNGVPRNRIARLNDDGSLDSGFNPGTGANDIVYTVAIQHDDKVLIGGAFTQVNGVARNRIARLNADGSLDTAFNPGTGTNDIVNAVALQPDGKALIGGYFTQVNGVVRNRIARLNQDGSLDTTFNPGTGANNWVGAVAVQPDGKVLIGGNFTLVNGMARHRIARLNANGFPDSGFDTSIGANDWVNAVALQPDGKVLIGGLFTTVDSTARNRIARLNADGSLDTSFNPGTGTNGVVNAVAVRPDGKVLIGGFFTQVDVQLRNHIARLNADGSLDTSFDPGTGPNWDVVDIVAQTDGKALIGGSFTQVGGVARNRIARLNADGTLDTGFDTSTAGPSGSVHAVALQPNGKVLIGGFFTHVAGTSRNCIARLNANGTLDTAFNPGTGADSTVFAVAVQPDGKVLLGGFFTHVQGLSRNRIARLYEDGSLDAGFDPDANGTVFAVAVQPDGKVLIGGGFTTVGGTARNHVARLNADGSLDTAFDPGSGADGIVDDLVLQPDGKVLIGGGFTQVSGTLCRRTARLNADGSLDTSFDTSTGTNDTVRTVAFQPDGKVLIGGQFTTVDGTARNRVARLNADGSLDTAFDPGTGTDDTVQAVAAQADGKVLIGGVFTQVNGTACNRVARLNADGSLDVGFDTSIGTNGTVHAIAAQVDGKVLIGGEFTQVNGQSREYIARLNGMTPPVITSTAPVAVTVGTAYSHTFTASGFPLPTFRVTSGSLPPGLALDATSGVLSGLPSVVGTYNFTVRASNYVTPSAYHAVVLTVDEAKLYLPLVMNSYQ